MSVGRLRSGGGDHGQLNGLGDDDHPQYLLRTDNAATFTTTTRDALSGGGLWVGRIIYNTTTAQHETWNGSAWVAVGGGGGFYRSFLTMGI